MLELRGKAVADAHRAVLASETETIKAQGGTIGMAILLVGNDMAAEMYAKFMEKTARNAGFDVRLEKLPQEATQEEVDALIEDFNKDENIYGVLPLMPVPPQIDGNRIIELLDPAKDVDGLTTYNIGLVTAGKGGFAPCTARACMAILDHYDISLEGKSVVVVGRSQVIGKPAALLALERNATVTICHSKTKNLEEVIKTGDVVIAAAGRAHMINGSMLKPGAVVIDVGINELDGQTVGDVDYASAESVASAATPVPGGVGSVTTTMMLEGVLKSYHARNVHR